MVGKLQRDRKRLGRLSRISAGRGQLKRCRNIFQGGDTGSVVIWGGYVVTNLQDGAGPEYFPTQSRATAHREADEETGVWELGITIIAGSNRGIRLQGGWDIHHEEAEQNNTVYCAETSSGPM